jgi:hypothetical protein
LRGSRQLSRDVCHIQEAIEAALGFLVEHLVLAGHVQREAVGDDVVGFAIEQAAADDVLVIDLIGAIGHLREVDSLARGSAAIAGHLLPWGAEAPLHRAAGAAGCFPAPAQPAA